MYKTPFRKFGHKLTNITTLTTRIFQGFLLVAHIGKYPDILQGAK